MTKHWPRWIYASLMKHFNSALTTAGLTIFIEGTKRDTNSLGEEHVEIRMDGPRVKELHANEYYVWVAMNILYKVSMNDRTFHRKHEMCGLILESYLTDIPLFKLGEGPDDDQSQFGCLSLDKSRKNGVQVNHFGQIDKNLNVEQGTVEGHYVTYLTDNS